MFSSLGDQPESAKKVVFAKFLFFFANNNMSLSYGSQFAPFGVITSH